MSKPAEFVFVEGKRDLELLKKVFKKCFKYEPNFWPYSSDKPKEVRKIIKKCNVTKIPYLFITDFDPLQFSCYNMRRKSRIKEFDAKEEYVIVAKCEIESWYSAGSYSEDLNKKGHKDEEISKEVFCSLIKESQYPEIVLAKICSRFNTVRAIRNSESFKYFYDKVKKLGMHEKRRN